MPHENHALRFYWNVLKDSVARFTDEDAPTQSAALAYFMVFSLPPMLLVTFWIADLFQKEVAVSEAVFAEMGELVGEEGARQLMVTMERLEIQEPTWWATAVGIGALLFTATTVFVTLENARYRIFGLEASKNSGLGIWKMLRDRFVSFAMLIIVSYLLTVSLVVDTLIAALGRFLGQWIGGLSAIVVALDSLLLEMAAITLLFALLFKYLPQVKLEWKDVWFGAVLTASLFVGGENLIAFVIGNSEVADLYDAAGSILVLMLWVYYASAIVLFGAIVTSTRARLLGNTVQAAGNLD